MNQITLTDEQLQELAEIIEALEGGEEIEEHYDQASYYQRNSREIIGWYYRLMNNQGKS